MTSKSDLKDMIIVLPGILGSVLQQGGRDVWNASVGMAGQLLTGNIVKNLQISGEDDPNKDDLGDGIVATQLMNDVAIIPGWAKQVNGYTGLRQAVENNFKVVSSLKTTEPANYFEFAYDWRRDNRFSARKLQELIQRELPRWRKASNNPNAKVVFIAHSMGGLIALYYLEVLGGWKNCKALITLGTPFHGAVEPLDNLVNGYKIAHFLETATAVRTFTSSYQLLPTYKAVQVGSQYKHLSEIELPNIKKEDVKKGLEFHLEIVKALKANRLLTNYGYIFRPIVGVNQPTKQSTVFTGGKLVSSTTVAPSGVNQNLIDGDGTVPYISAYPDGLAKDMDGVFVTGIHGALPGNETILTHLERTLTNLYTEFPDLGDFSFSADDPAISLEVDDVYLPDEPIIIRANLINAQTPAHWTVDIRPVEATNPAVTVPLVAADEGWQATVSPRLPAGTYRAILINPNKPQEQLTDIFVVA